MVIKESARSSASLHKAALTPAKNRRPLLLMARALICCPWSAVEKWQEQVRSSFRIRTCALQLCFALCTLPHCLRCRQNHASLAVSWFQIDLVMAF